MPHEARSKPTLDEVGWLAWSLEAASLMAAGVLLLLQARRLAGLAELWRWWAPLVGLAALALADLATGVVHWIADTWGSESLPWLGPRFLRPFRIHHVNPDDILRRGFVDLNGDVALLTLPLFAGGFLIPLSDDAGRLALLFLVAFGACSLPTNQLHQWAHHDQPPRWVGWLQRRGLILSRQRHQRHHTPPFATHYCITTGWCNPLLAAIGFFPALEGLISRLTGLVPRSGDPEWARALESRDVRQSEEAAEEGA